MKILNLKTKENNMKGITLVSLVITIIVLLILTTVSINLIINNGILDKAKTAVDKYSENEIRERIMLSVTNAKMKNMGLLDRTTLDNELKSEFGEGNYELLSVGEGFLISVNNIEYFVDKDGNINNGNKIEESNIEYAGDLSKNGQYDGTTEETAYRITCIEDLVEWSNNPGNYSSKNIKLENTIDFNSTASYKNARAKKTDINGNGKIEELITELTTGKGFKPIGWYSGTFDGKNNEIINIFENKTNYAGLFEQISNATIKNLGLTGKIIGTFYVGGIAGTRGSNTENNIEKCYFSGYIKGEAAGGIFGGYGSQDGKIIINDCYNEGNIEGGSNIGGIIGYDRNTCIVINSYNIGNISGNGQVGGILGYANGSGISIYNVYNRGNVYSSSHAGGIIGWAYSGATIKNAYNIGNINPIGNNPLATKVSWVTVNTNNAFYIDSTDVKGINVINDTTTSFDKNYIESQEIVSKLNEYVNTYNEEHKNDTDFVSLSRWKYSAGNYPTFE